MSTQMHHRMRVGFEDRRGGGAYVIRICPNKEVYTIKRDSFLKPKTKTQSQNKKPKWTTTTHAGLSMT